jgi:hypothetical protein
MRSILVFLAMLIAFAPIASATDYSLLEDACESVLINGESTGIYRAVVDVHGFFGPKMDITYRSISTTEEDMLIDIAAVLGVYQGAVIEYPEIGDLKATIEGVNGSEIGTFACKRAWVDDVDVANESQYSDLLVKVLGTIEVEG